MRLWTYTRPFHYYGQACVVEVSLTLTHCVSRLFVEDLCVDEQSYHYMDGVETIVHPLPHHYGATDAVVEVGYINWWTVGILVTAQSTVLYESHPGRDVRFGEKLSHRMRDHEGDGPVEAAGAAAATRQASRGNWQRNKYSIYADLALGGLFFVVGKLTQDLALAAIVGAGAGLALVVVQRFVKVDLLGGFAVFGTIMLLISAGFSLALQDDYWVQMKSSVLGLLTASVFMIDGLFRKGAYFGARIERYMPLALHHGRIAVGMSVVGIAMAGANYLAANHFSEDFWLTYTTFLDLPLGMALFYAVLFWARRKPE
jgi:intracellular septation protein A